MITVPNQEIIAEKIAALFQEYPELNSIVTSRSQYNPNRITVDAYTLENGRHDGFDMMMEIEAKQ